MKLLWQKIKYLYIDADSAQGNDIKHVHNRSFLIPAQLESPKIYVINSRRDFINLNTDSAEISNNKTVMEFSTLHESIQDSFYNHDVLEDIAILPSPQSLDFNVVTSFKLASNSNSLASNMQKLTMRANSKCKPN